MLDTGSTVTTLSRSFYDKHLSHIEIQPLSNILKIECADGNHLPYDGYVEIDLGVTGLPVNQKQTCLALIVAQSTYNTKVPLLIGTNVLSVFLNACTEVCGNRILQTSNVNTAWNISFKSISKI